MVESNFHLIIEPGRSEKNYWRDLWRYRELFYILVWRDVKVRYKQTIVGIAWSVIRPLLILLIFTIVFSRIAKLPSEGDAPYAIMVFAGLIPWLFFSNSITESSNSLIGNASLISKVYFPRLIIPTSAIITSFIDLLISIVLMFGLMIYFEYLPSWHIIFIPGFIIMAFLASFGLGLWLTTMNVKYRDFRFIVPFIVQIGLYISPVGFSTNNIPEKWRLLFSLNPMVGIIDGFRWCILQGENKLYLPGFVLSLSVILIITLYSIRNFRKMEKGFADFI